MKPRMKRRPAMHEGIIKELEEISRNNPAPDRDVCLSLAKKFNYSEHTIYRWFWQQRTKRISKTHSAYKTNSRLGRPSRRGSGSTSQSTFSNTSESTPLRTFPTSKHNSVPHRNGSDSPREAQWRQQQGNQNNIDSRGHSSLTPSMGENLVSQARMKPTSNWGPHFGYRTAQPLDNFRRTQSTPISRQLSGELFGSLVPREVSMLERVFQEVPNPTKEDVVRLASRFVREQEKETEIRTWFANRQAAYRGEPVQGSYNSLHNDPGLRPVSNQAELRFLNSNQMYQVENPTDEMQFEISTDSLVFQDPGCSVVSPPETPELRPDIPYQNITVDVDVHQDSDSSLVEEDTETVENEFEISAPIEQQCSVISATQLAIEHSQLTTKEKESEILTESQVHENKCQGELLLKPQEEVNKECETNGTVTKETSIAEAGTKETDTEAFMLALGLGAFMKGGQ